jgi:hypothetical protein
MKRRLALLILAGSMTIPVFAAKGPEVDMVDHKLSINAEAVSLGRLLRLFDLATGMKSKVPAELANRNISVRFSDLNVTDGVRKIFQGQPLDYVVIEGQGIIVTAAAQASTGEPAPAYNPQPPVEQPFVQDPQAQMQQFQQQQQQQLQPGQQPAMIQTPFGPQPNPNVRQQQPNAPLSAPGQQQNSLFPQSPPVNQPNNQQIAPPFPGAQPTVVTPFGAAPPFGTQQQPPVSQPNSLFGSPSLIGQPHTP